MSHENIFIGEFEPVDPAPGVIRVAVKDNIDVAGLPTTAGSRSRKDAGPAAEDAPVVTSLRAAGVKIVGKTNLDEFANGATGENPWFGDVVNPRDPERMIGGSSSGSAAAVAHGLADFALGTDTGGSVRIPAALSGTAGLKTTKGLLSTRGVHPLSERLDVVGPMAKDTAGLRIAMNILAPEYARDPGMPERPRVARLRFPEEETVVDEAVDAALAAAGWEVEELTLPGWGQAHVAAYTILSRQCWINNRGAFEQVPGDIGAVASMVINDGTGVTLDAYNEAYRFANDWARTVDDLFKEYQLLVSPTLSDVAPRFADLASLDWGSFSRTMQFNLSGHPALSLPLELPDSDLTGGLQLVGPYASEFELLDHGAQLETSLGHVSG